MQEIRALLLRREGHRLNILEYLGQINNVPLHVYFKLQYIQTEELDYGPSPPDKEDGKPKASTHFTQ